MSAGENVFFKYLLEPQIAGQAEKFFDLMLKADDAHALMLLEEGILREDEARQLLNFSRQLSAQGVDAIELTPEKEDLYLNIEAHLIDTLGDYVGGKLHTGRSRNDLYATIQRIKCRDMVLDAADDMLDLRRVLLRIAEENTETIIPGYTHMQPAQPITFGYYLAALGHAFERDFERLAAAYARTNLNPLGACALAGTGFPIDRTLVGSYLGFDGNLENALDAVASRDYVADIVFAMTMLLSDIGRINQDFYFWVTSEFSILKLPDEFVVGSSIMPQKRNPIIFEHTMGKLSCLLGAFVSVITAMKGVPYTHSRATSGEVFTTLWGAFDETRAAVKCMSAVLEKIEIDKENALRNTNKNFSTATEVADEIVRKMDVSFRTAYQIVKKSVLPLYRQGKTSEALTLEELNHAAMEVLQRPLEITAEDVERALSPLGNVKKRTVLGGPAPETVSKDLEEMRLRLQGHARQVQDWRGKIESSENTRKDKIARIIGKAEI
ncbi:argininosuccinate lyase [Oleispirillum naphthae]|uniref:argininosuccinate lyase n=1 Tax=Oleispirillum naphthae TaxID=2838853 RepID=UPI0030825E6D